MSCYHPSPIPVERLDGRLEDVTVRCGRCLGCRASEAAQWAIRLTHESVWHQGASWFVTLTYSDNNLPGLWPDDGRTYGSLCPDDLSRFLKRLRKRSSNKLKYFACGEYGDTTDRPHYHLGLCGMQLLDRVEVGRRSGLPVYRSETLEQAWGLGRTEFTAMSWRSASYVTGYVTKKFASPHEDVRYTRCDTQTGELVEVEPEFRRMSRRPGLGRHFLERYWRDIYPRDEVIIDGQSYKPPRYYDDVMSQIQPEIIEEVKYRRWKESENVPDEQLLSREVSHKARLRFFGNGRKTL